MSDALRYGLTALVILLTHFQEGVTGFGCTVLALPFVTLLLGLNTAVPVLVLQGWLIALLIVIESRKKIVWSEFGKLLLLVGIGMPVGMWMSGAIPEMGLRWVLAVFMLGVGAQGLIKHLAPNVAGQDASPRTKAVASLFLPLGGIIHGAFGSGGPLIVIYAAKALTDKSLFRVTLCLLWAVLNTGLIVQWVVISKLDAHVMKIAGACLPFTLAGFFLGNHAHYRIDELAFRRVIYSVLTASGIVLIWSLVS